MASDQWSVTRKGELGFAVLNPTYGLNRDLEKIFMGFLSRSLFTHLIIRYPLI